MHVCVQTGWVSVVKVEASKLSCNRMCCIFPLLLWEIAHREAALSEREGNIGQLSVGERPNNFSPFPKFCSAPFKPCFYINVKVEVPPSEQLKVYMLLGLLVCKSGTDSFYSENDDVIMLTSDKY